ncbi:hypothetical protein C8T65DRAFT_71974 [Cerioporus squamosus]|nr:hypothetical protein C8T65DRAFT_71974 [Cerioporus squamosus]
MSVTLPANRAATLPVLTTVTFVELYINADEYTMRASRDATLLDETASFSLASGDIFEWDAYLQSCGLRDLVDIFRGAPLTRISIAGDFNSVVNSDDWRTVFAAFPKLEVLECYACGKSLTSLVWKALELDDPTQAITCPQLRSISMDGCVVTSREGATLFFERILACLLSRFIPDGRRMQELALGLRSLGEVQDRRLRQDYAPGLQNLVEHEVRLHFYQ